MNAKIKKRILILLCSVVFMLLFQYVFLDQVFFRKENIQIANFYSNNENFVSAIKNNNTAQITNFLDVGKYDLDYRDKQEHRSLLMWSVVHKNDFLTKRFIEMGANVNFVDQVWGLTPLHFAVSDGKIEIVKLLIKKGHKINCRENKHGLTPLDIAIKRKNKEITDFLIENGAKKSSDL